MNFCLKTLGGYFLYLCQCVFTYESPVIFKRKIMKHPVFFLLALFACSCQTATNSDLSIQGELMQWHKVTLLINGPATSEYADENPFLDYRVDVTFSNGTDSYKVPGFYAADGQAGESSAREGAVWKVHFRPDTPGTWTYTVSFLKGKNIAVLDGDIEAESLGTHGTEGTLEIGVSDKSGPDLRARGRIINGGRAISEFRELMSSGSRTERIVPRISWPMQILTRPCVSA